MNYNIVSYIIYLGISFYITFVVGKLCYVKGEIYLLEIFKDKQATVKAINSLLLTAYYLLNMGYIAMMLNDWVLIKSVAHLLAELVARLGKIVFLLGALHYMNLLVTFLVSKKINKHQKFKSITS